MMMMMMMMMMMKQVKKKWHFHLEHDKVIVLTIRIKEVYHYSFI